MSNVSPVNQKNDAIQHDAISENQQIHDQEVDYNKIVEKIGLENVKLFFVLRKYLHNEVQNINNEYKAQIKLRAGHYRSVVPLALTALSTSIQGAHVLALVIPASPPKMKGLLELFDKMTQGGKHIADNIVQAKRVEADEETNHLRSRTEQIMQEYRRYAQDQNDAFKKLDQFVSGEHSEKMGMAR